MDYYLNYLFIGLFSVVAIFFGIAPLVANRLLAPRKPNPTKQMPYECGDVAVGDAWIQSKVYFYLYALLFVVFDVEIIFVVPWAVAFRKLGLLGLVEMGIFLAILTVGLMYAWRKGALEWEK